MYLTDHKTVRLPGQQEKKKIDCKKSNLFIIHNCRKCTKNLEHR